MASPVVAGVAAILKQIHPDWSPWRIKSAILTSASVTDNKGDSIDFGTQYSSSNPNVANLPQGPFDFGSGEINPAAAADPGLVYDTTFQDYINFLYSMDTDVASFMIPSLLPTEMTLVRDLNLPSISVSMLSGTVTVTRTVTCVGKKGKSKYSAEVVSPLGVQVVVEPMAFSTVAGESVAFTVTLKVLSPSKDKGFVFGSLTWKNGQYSVRSPIVVQPISL
eukprot:TRINITY_DN5888_c0_g1_i2.p1 TRINITY_DN5888_c0_g1~~TRINITY_DN5888_c0_g1_i2.p1  ORF type:complete len:242 (+),score=41.21 TRINITY_DN5888_c0_g1_i2:64-726(+)